ncbi:MAG: hypothetical protein Tsb009_01870 [Planctomycetaceae bacterium]
MKPFRTRILVACLFWGLCLTLTAAGHRLYKAVVHVDRSISANHYQTGEGAALVWVGRRSLDDTVKRIAPENSSVEISRLTVLPNSAFWLSAAVFFTAIAGMMAWSGRWVANNGLQSLLGLFAGHFLWLGAIEFGLAVAARSLGLAGSLEIVEGKIVGTHGGGILIQLSVFFLVPMLVGLTMHESNRCAVFQWLRKRLPITRTVAATGRVENYAARTTIQYFMTVWFCYVSVLWLADPRLGKAGQIGLLVTLGVIVIATPYMIWRTTRQAGNSQALRYSVSGAVVTWTGIEIAAAMNFFHEPWLSNSVSSGVIWLGLSILLTLVSAWMLLPRRGRSIRTPIHGAVSVGLAIFVVGLAGCSQDDQRSDQSAKDIQRQLREYDTKIKAVKSSASEGMQHALYSSDPQMRAQAAIAYGKSRRVNSTVKERLQTMARTDDSRLSQFAAFMALKRLGLLSSELNGLLRELEADPQWKTVVDYVRNG